MNRRNFLMGGGILGIVAAIVATVESEASTTGQKKVCDGMHAPMSEYTGERTGTAITMSAGNDRLRALVPCKHCGVMFALHIPEGGSSSSGISCRAPRSKYWCGV